MRSIEGPGIPPPEKGEPDSAENGERDIEQLDAEIEQQEEALEANKEKLQGIVTDLVETGGEDPAELEERRETLLQRIEALKEKVDSKLKGRAGVLAAVSAFTGSLVTNTEPATLERVVTMAEWGAAGAAIAALVWAVQRITLAIEERKAHQGAGGEQD